MTMTREEWGKEIMESIRGENYKKTLELLASNTRDKGNIEKFLVNFVNTFYAKADEDDDDIPTLNDNPDAELVMHCRMAIFLTKDGRRVVASDVSSKRIAYFFQTWIQNLYDSLPY